MRHSFRIWVVFNILALPAPALAGEPAITFTEPARLRGTTATEVTLSARATISDGATFRVLWVVSRHADLDRPFAASTVLVKPDNGGRVQLTIERLRPETEYFVQFRYRDATTETVAVRTTAQKIAATN